jgi:hypothetical protein
LLTIAQGGVKNDEFFWGCYGGHGVLLKWLQAVNENGQGKEKGPVC